VFAGIALAAACPLLFGFGVLLSVLFPACSQPGTSGCNPLGLDLYSIMSVGYWWGFVGSFFLVPIGVVVMTIGVLARAFGKSNSDA
jgi:hypothetical protein